MRTLAGLTLAVWVASVPGASLHDHGCAPTAADPATVNAFVLPDGRTFYVEERGASVGASPPVPGWGLLGGGGTHWYEESNGVAGM